MACEATGEASATRRISGSATLQQGLGGILGDEGTGGVAEADNFGPGGAGGGIGHDQRAEYYRYAAGAREDRFVAEDLAGAAHGYGANRALGIDGGFERA